MQGSILTNSQLHTPLVKQGALNTLEQHLSLQVGF